MTTIPTHASNLQDDRWGDYIPWFLRHPDLAIVGQFELFFDRVAHRVEQFVLYGEGGAINGGHMGALIESESHQRFRFNNSKALAAQLETYFSSAQIASETEGCTAIDPQIAMQRSIIQSIGNKLVKKYGQDIQRIRLDPAPEGAKKDLLTLTSKRRKYYREQLISARLTVLESVLRLVEQTPNFPRLRADLRRYLAEAQLMLDITEKPTWIVPMEESLLQKEVIDRLLPRLANRFPQQEMDLVKAYHDLVQGVDPDAIFVLAVKALEEIARKVSGKARLTLDDDKNLKKAFPDLHPTIYATIIKLAAHRGDKAGHGRQGPPPHEMRYLLFSICNVALLFLDHPSFTNVGSAS